MPPAPSKSDFPTTTEFRATFLLLLTLFFCWGLLVSLNDFLSIYLRQQLNLSYHSTLAVQAIFFGTCFVSAPLVGRVIEHLGYKRTIVLGLFTMAGGALLMVAATFAHLSGRWIFLSASAVLGLGINLLQTAAAPYITHLGPGETAPRRFSFALGFNSLGTMVAPLIGSRWLLARLAACSLFSHAISPLVLPYLTIAAALCALAILLTRLHLPTLSEELAMRRQQHATRFSALLRHRRLTFGALAMFCYVGSEVGIGSLLVPYLHNPAAGALPLSIAGLLPSFYWGGLMAGRFIALPWLIQRRAPAAVAIAAAGAAVLLSVSISSQGTVAVCTILLIGLCNSIIVPLLFDLSTTDLGEETALAASVMSAMIIGGAVLPISIGALADYAGLHHSFLLLLPCYLVVVTYGISYQPLFAPGSDNRH